MAWLGPQTRSGVGVRVKARQGGRRGFETGVAEAELGVMWQGTAASQHLRFGAGRKARHAAASRR